MKTKLLVTTAAMALTLGVAGPAAAQQSYGEGARGDHSAAQKYNQHDRSNAMNRGGNDRGTTGQAAGQEEQGNRGATDKTRAAPQRNGQTTGEGTASDRDTNNSDAARDHRSGNMNRSGEASDKAGNTDARTNAQSSHGSNAQQDRHAQTPASDKDQKQTSGAAAERNERSAQQPNATGTDRNARGEATGERSRNRANASGTSGHAQPERLSASLKGSKASHLTHAVAELNVKPISHVDFSVSVGTEVPRTVVLHPVPETIVDIIPEYRDYDYFVVRDEVIIVAPRTHRIVDVIERHGSAHAESTTTKSRKVHLSAKDRRYLTTHMKTRRTVTTGAAPAETHIIVGEDAPATAEVETFSPEIYREVPAVRSYRYIHSGDNVYLVDPGSRRVIEQIDEDDD